MKTNLILKASLTILLISLAVGFCAETIAFFQTLNLVPFAFYAEVTFCILSIIVIFGLATLAVLMAK